MKYICYGANNQQKYTDKIIKYIREDIHIQITDIIC